MTTTEQTALLMHLDSAMVGRVVAYRDVDVDFHTSALYAAAITAERDIYLDDRTKGGAMAPPCFITSLEWPLVSGPGFLAAVGLAPDDLFPHLLHMFQDSTFFAPVRVGDRLSLEATLESVTQVRTGAMAVTRITTVNARSNRPVAESWFGGYFRNMHVPLPRRSRTPPVILPLALQDPIAHDMISISRGESHVYSECARLRNPIHTDLGFATALGLPDVALHGTLLWARMGELAIDRYLGGHPANLRRLATQFRRPILPYRPMRITTCLVGQCPEHIALHLHDHTSGDLLSEGVAEFGDRI